VGPGWLGLGKCGAADQPARAPNSLLLRCPFSPQPIRYCIVNLGHKPQHTVSNDQTGINITTCKLRTFRAATQPWQRAYEIGRCAFDTPEVWHSEAWTALDQQQRQIAKAARAAGGPARAAKRKMGKRRKHKPLGAVFHQSGTLQDPAVPVSSSACGIWLGHALVASAVITPTALQSPRPNSPRPNPSTNPTHPTHNRPATTAASTATVTAAVTAPVTW